VYLQFLACLWFGSNTEDGATFIWQTASKILLLISQFKIIDKIKHHMISCSCSICHLQGKMLEHLQHRMQLNPESWRYSLTYMSGTRIKILEGLGGWSYVSGRVLGISYFLRYNIWFCIVTAVWDRTEMSLCHSSCHTFCRDLPHCNSLIKYFYLKNLNIQNYNFACGFIWVWNLVSDIKGGT
jgi:hypothetical protein